MAEDILQVLQEAQARKGVNLQELQKGGYPVGTVRNGYKKVADSGKGDWVKIEESKASNEDFKEKQKNPFESHSIYFKNESVDNNGYKSKDLTAIDKKTKQEIILGKYQEKREWYSKDPRSMINDSIRKNYNFYWNKEGIEKFLGKDIELGRDMTKFLVSSPLSSTSLINILKEKL